MAEKKLRRLHRLLFSLLILFLPTQLGKHFWPRWSMVLGIRVDYLSPTVYLTDLLLVGLLILVAAERWGERKSLFKSLSAITFRGPIGCQNVRVILGLAGGLIFLSLGVVGSIRPLAGFYKLLKLVEFFLLGLWVKNNFVALLPCCLVAVFSLTIIYSSLIAWGQFLRQGSLGGLFWWLGERTFTSSTPGIAQVVLNGQLFLRPYATFSHPNVLGGYLATVIPLIITQISNVKSQNYSLNLITILKMLAIFLGVATLFITFSRAAWLVGGIGIILSGLLPSFRKAKKESKKRSSLFSVLCSLFSVLCSLFLVLFLFLGRERLTSLKADTESIRLRRELNRAALLMIKDRPLTGVGLNNFIPTLSRFKKGLRYKQLQPAHNIYLLIGAETGLVGLGMFVWLIGKSYQKLLSGNKVTRRQGNKELPITNYQLLIALTTILLLGLFDHYFYTLQQSQLLFVLVLGAIFGVR